MLALLLLIAAQPAEIIVTGKRLQDAHAICDQGGCTPLRDAQVSIALAEVQFRDGRYLIAKRLLAAAVARNKKHAATDPRPVAALYEAYATVALHEGDQDAYRRAVAGQVRTLRENLPADDPAVAAAAPALGDMWIKLRDYRQADATFRSVERSATQAGQDRTALLVAVRRTWLAAAQGQPARAGRMLDEIEARPIAKDPTLRIVLRVMRFRIAAYGADDEQMATLAAEMGRLQGASPELISAPPFETDAVTAAWTEARKFGTTDALQVQSSDFGEIQWIDVGFWIRPNGRTAEAEVLRGFRKANWVPAVLTQVEGRRYSAVPAGTAAATDIDTGIYRIERVTLRSKYTTPSGSLISRRANAGGFEILDLTETPSAAVK